MNIYNFNKIITLNKVFVEFYFIRKHFNTRTNTNYIFFIERGRKMLVKHHRITMAI